MTTYIRKNHYGNWVAETEIPLEGKQALCFHTSKDTRKNVTTRVSVHTISDDGRSRTHAMFSDYSKSVLSEACKRVTSAVVEEQHKRALARLEDIKAAVAQHYEAKKGENNAALV